MPKISIIIPIFRVEKYIEKCLDSIITQECEGIDLECILVNDCTPDDSMEVVAKKLQDYNGQINFIVKHHDVNRGHCAARNTGLKLHLATTYYLWTLTTFLHRRPSIAFMRNWIKMILTK